MHLHFPQIEKPNPICSRFGFFAFLCHALAPLLEDNLPMCNVVVLVEFSPFIHRVNNYINFTI